MAPCGHGRSHGLLFALRPEPHCSEGSGLGHTPSIATAPSNLRPHPFPHKQCTSQRGLGATSWFSVHSFSKYSLSLRYVLGISRLWAYAVNNLKPLSSWHSREGNSQWTSNQISFISSLSAMEKIWLGIIGVMFDDAGRWRMGWSRKASPEREHLNRSLSHGKREPHEGLGKVYQARWVQSKVDCPTMGKRPLWLESVERGAEWQEARPEMRAGPKQEELRVDDNP